MTWRRSIMAIAVALLLGTTVNRFIGYINPRERIENEMLAGENEHDGAIALMRIGDMGSVPALMRVLDDQPPRFLGNGGMYVRPCGRGASNNHRAGPHEL